jgi:hypothetical protein
MPAQTTAPATIDVVSARVIVVSQRVFSSTAFSNATLGVTRDGGRTWRVSHVPAGGVAFAPDGRHGIVVGGVQDRDVQATRDAGRSWWTVSVPRPRSARRGSHPACGPGVVVRGARYELACSWGAGFGRATLSLVDVPERPPGRAVSVAAGAFPGGRDFGASELPGAYDPATGRWTLALGARLFALTHVGVRSRRIDVVGGYDFSDTAITYVLEAGHGVVLLFGNHGSCTGFKQCTESSVELRSTDHGQTFEEVT